MAKSSATRNANWVARMQGEAVSPATMRSFASVLGTPSIIVSAFMNATEETVALEGLVRQVLNEAGVPTIQYPFYLSFGRQLWKILRKGIVLNGPVTAIGPVEVAAQKAVWVARGLDAGILSVIAADVSGVWPITPAPTRLTPQPNIGITLPYLFTWEAVTDATKYDLKIFAHSTGIIVYEDNNVTDTSKSVTDAMIAKGQTFDWTVRAYVGAWGPDAIPNWAFYTHP